MFLFWLSRLLLRNPLVTSWWLLYVWQAMSYVTCCFQVSYLCFMQLYDKVFGWNLWIESTRDVWASCTWTSRSPSRSGKLAVIVPLSKHHSPPTSLILRFSSHMFRSLGGIPQIMTFDCDLILDFYSTHLFCVCWGCRHLQAVPRVRRVEDSLAEAGTQLPPCFWSKLSLDIFATVLMRAFRLFSCLCLPLLCKNAGAEVAFFMWVLGSSLQVVRVVQQALLPAETFCCPHCGLILVFRLGSFNGPDFHFSGSFLANQADCCHP